MKLGLDVGYSGQHIRIPIEKIQLAEALGYDSVWSAEVYGSDAWSPLAYIAAKTSHIRLGTAIQQLAGRPPVMAAMQAATIDALAGGDRVIIGIGMSGPQIVEGWFGQPWGKPYYRMKDYVTIIRKTLAREIVEHDGREIALPFMGDGALGIGKPLKSILHMNPDIPIWLGTGTETMVRLTGEIADGWLPLRMTPEYVDKAKGWIAEGAAKAGKTLDDIETQSGVPVQITDDVRGAIDAAKPNTALYVGGMGHKTLNFHKRMIGRTRFRRGGGTHPGAVPRQTQGRGRRGRAGRIHRRGGPVRPERAHPSALPGLGRCRVHRPDRGYRSGGGGAFHGGTGGAE